jgi:hypothetical protein
MSAFEGGKLVEKSGESKRLRARVRSRIEREREREQ